MSKNQRWIGSFLFSFSAVLGSAQTFYSVIDVGTLPGRTTSYAQGMNNSGYVVGWSGPSVADTHGFLYNGVSLIDLGFLPGGAANVAQGINNGGQVVGSASNASGDNHAYLYNGVSLIDLGTLPGGLRSTAHRINTSGQVVGSATTTTAASGPNHAFRYSGGAMVDLGTLPGATDSFGWAINDSGQVVGDSGTGGSTHAFLYSGGSLINLGTLPGGTFSYAYGINNSGQIAGNSGITGGYSRAFLYNGGSMTDLGTLPGGLYSYASGINNNGQVVGFAGTSSGFNHAVLYSGGSVTDLNSVVNLPAGVSLQTAQAINDVGQIVATGSDSHAYLLTPGTGSAVSAVSVTPSTGNTANANLTAVYSHTAGYANLEHEYLLINTAVNGSNACYVVYQGSNNTLMLANDTGTAFLGPIVAGTSATLQNSQCILNGSGSSGVGSGNSLSLTLSLSFKAAFAGSKTVFLNADGGGLGAGWQSRGTWTVPGGATVVTADSVSPASGNAANATLTAVYSDTAGFASLGHEYLLINTALNGSNACYVVYQGSNNTLLLANDAGTAFLGPIVAGTGATLQNSQCILNGIGSSGVGSGNSLSLTVSLSFKAAFAGSKTVFLNADGGGQGAGWQSRGTWTVPSSAVVTVDSVSPSSGNSANATLTAVYSDTAGFPNLAHEYLLINTAVNGSSACYVVYQGSNNTLLLANDAGTAWLGPIVAGTSATLQNSQCILNGIGSSGVGSGNSVTLTVSLNFKAAFAGSKTVFLNADGGGLNSGWQSRGIWTVPGGATVVTADSVSPTSGSTANATLTAVYSDTAGFANLGHEYLLINTAVNGANACYVVYQGSNNTLLLANDAGTAFLGPIVAGTNATLQNSQCVLNGIGSSGVGSGNSLTLTVSLSFMPAFTGSKTVFLNADGGGVGAGWQSRGTWTVP